MQMTRHKDITTKTSSITVPLLYKDMVSFLGWKVSNYINHVRKDLWTAFGGLKTA